jgi:hypothetical protein
VQGRINTRRKRNERKEGFGSSQNTPAMLCVSKQWTGCGTVVATATVPVTATVTATATAMDGYGYSYGYGYCSATTIAAAVMIIADGRA